jgi:hypothetical protein
MKIVEVEWSDACSNSGYLDKEHWETTHKPVRCKTVGHLFKKSREVVILCGEKFEDGEKRHIHTIPRKMVVNIRELK